MVSFALVFISTFVLFVWNTNAEIVNIEVGDNKFTITYRQYESDPADSQRTRFLDDTFEHAIYTFTQTEPIYLYDKPNQQKETFEIKELPSEINSVISSFTPELITAEQRFWKCYCWKYNEAQSTFQFIPIENKAQSVRQNDVQCNNPPQSAATKKIGKDHLISQIRQGRVAFAGFDHKKHKPMPMLLKFPCGGVHYMKTEGKTGMFVVNGFIGLRVLFKENTVGTEVTKRKYGISRDEYVSFLPNCYLIQKTKRSFGALVIDEIDVSGNVKTKSKREYKQEVFENMVKQGIRNKNDEIVVDLQKKSAANSYYGDGLYNDESDDAVSYGYIVIIASVIGIMFLFCFCFCVVLGLIFGYVIGDIWKKEQNQVDIDFAHAKI